METTSIQKQITAQEKVPRKKWNNRKKNKGKGNGKQQTGPPFEGLSKEVDFKGVIIKHRKPSIQS